MSWCRSQIDSYSEHVCSLSDIDSLTDMGRVHRVATINNLRTIRSQVRCSLGATMNQNLPENEYRRKSGLPVCEAARDLEFF